MPNRKIDFNKNKIIYENANHEYRNKDDGEKASDLEKEFREYFMVSKVYYPKKNSTSYDIRFNNFEQYLRNKGLKEQTIKAYISTLNKIMNEYGITSISDLETKIEDLCNEYQGKDSEFHNNHTAPLNNYRDYLKK